MEEKHLPGIGKEHFLALGQKSSEATNLSTVWPTGREQQESVLTGFLGVAGGLCQYRSENSEKPQDREGQCSLTGCTANAARICSVWSPQGWVL